MFERGIWNDKFVDALKNWEHWPEIISDEDLFVAIRKEYINIYYQGCSLFKISYKDELLFRTHYKYLVSPNVKNPYVLWKGERPAVEDRVNEILIHKFDRVSLKKSSSWYAEAEKEGVHKILRSNGNVLDVEVALSRESEIETDSDDPITKGKRVADRIDFAAIQRRKDGKPCIVFFEAKRFDNGELRSWKPEPPVFEQIRKYETFIQKYRPEMETSYRRVCENLVKLVPPNRYDPLVKEVADSPEQLTVDSDVRLVVFGYSRDEDKGEVWKDHKKILQEQFKSRLLMKGNPTGFTKGISEYSLKDPA